MSEVRTQLTQIWFGDTTLKEILKVADLGEFGGQADDIDITNLKSAAKQFLTGLVDNGELTLQINLDPSDTVHQDLQAAAGTGVIYPFCVGLSDGTTAPTFATSVMTPPADTDRTSFVFDATVKSFRFGAKMNDAIRVTCALRITGAVSPTWKT